MIDLASSPLLTDLYQLNMLQAYHESGMTETAVFEFFVRKLPEQRGFLVAAGLESVVDYLEGLQFSGEELQWLADSGRFSGGFLDSLAAFRFTGSLEAMPEGTLVFADEPILRVTAPMPQAQLVETRIVNLMQVQMAIATKAARMVLMAPDRDLVDFGLRRAHGAEAGLLAARAAYLAGFAGSATVLAGQRFGVPLLGTMAHSFIQAHDDETAAFIDFSRARPEQTTLLIDTYDTEAAAHKVVALAPRLRQEGIKIKGVRLDSGDLGAHAHAVRRILDQGGLKDVKIVASGGLDEFELRRLAEAPIDAYGIGTSLTTSQDAPSLDCVYKLQSYAGKPRRKLSEGKATWPDAKQVYRRYDEEGRLAGDILTLARCEAEGAPLLKPVMRDGRRIEPLPSLEEARRHAAEELRRLPEHLRRLETKPAYEAEIAQPLRALAEELDAELVAEAAAD